MRGRAWVAATTLLAVGSGCGSASSTYAPRFVARGELTLRYDDGVEIYAGKKRLTDAPGFGGLTQYVRCVEPAREHAEAAESDGTAAIGTGIAGSIIGVSGLGGLAGLAFLEDDKPLAFGLLGTGVAVGLVGMTLALISRGLKNSANGHAVDAINFYNDEVGFYGGGCGFKAPKPRKIIVVPAAQPEPEPEPELEPEPEEAPEPVPTDAEGVPIPDAAEQPEEALVPEEPSDGSDVKPRSVDSVLEPD